MAMKTKSNKMGNELGCGLMEKIFHLKSPKLKNSLVHSLPMMKTSNIDHVITEQKMSPNNEQKVPQRISINTELSKPSTLSVDHSQYKTNHSHLNFNNKNTRKSSFSIHETNRKNILDATSRNSTSSSSTSSSTNKSVHQNHNTNDDSKLKIEPTASSLQLARIKTFHKQDNESNKSIAKDFSTLKLTGNLLVNNTPRRKSVECLPKHSESSSLSSFHNSNGIKGVMGNIMRKNSNELAQFLSQSHKSLDPEVLKTMGNEKYKKGRFEEALALYDKAIALDSNKATYHCNKSAALIGLGRFQEAIFECEESIRLEPSYNRAHNRLATIYFRYFDNNIYKG